MSAWLNIEQQVWDGLFGFSPNYGRIAGDHGYDGVVGDAGRTSIAARVVEIDRHLRELESARDLTRQEDADRRALLAELAGSRLELVELRRPFTDPMFYATEVSELDVGSYIKREYAPLGERLAALRMHLDGIAGYLESARSNLEQSLSKPHLEVAIEAIDGQVDCLRGEVTMAAADNPETLNSIDRAAAQVAEFSIWLRERLPRAHDHYALGPELFLRYLASRDLIVRDLATLEKMARDDIAHNLERAGEVAARIVPGGDVNVALKLLEDDHPTVASMVPDTQAMLEGIRSFLIEHDIVTIPSEVRCRVAPTPSSFAYFSAALDSAGPLENVADESYFYVTVPSPDWDERRTEEWLRYLNYSALENISIHEAYPGHYLQALHQRKLGSLTRKLIWAYSTGEGWAHYTEQMMVEEHYAITPKLELAQLMGALMRNCRFLVALGLHCREMPMQEAIRTFMDQAFHSELPATREAVRGAWDPLYLNYTLGKLLIHEVRKQAESRPGFSVKRFHDSFLEQGNLPIPLVSELISVS